MMAIDKQRQAMEHGDDQVIVQLERFAWMEYARPRFTLGGDLERKARTEFVDVVGRAIATMRVRAGRAGHKLDFSEVRLRYVALQALAHACLYCGQLFGHATLGIVYEIPPERKGSASWGRANVRVCCADPCAAGKGSLAGHEWLNVLEVVRVAEPGAARELLSAIVAGRGLRDGRVGKRYSPGRTPRG